MVQQQQRLYEFGPYRLDPAQQLLSEGNRKIPLTPKAFQTLQVLVEAEGRVVAKDELLQKVWPDTFVEEATLAQNVFTLRKQLRDDREKAIYIETVPKKGYRFVATVRVEEPPPATGSKSADNVVPPPFRSVAQKWPRQVSLVVAALLMAAAAALIWFGRSRNWGTQGSDRVMLAVLPVKNLTGDPAQEYLVDGLTEEMIADLGSVNPQRLGVIARTSAMVYKQTNKNVQQIARELGANYVLESSLRKDADQVRFTSQLIRAQDQTHVWAQNYDRPESNVLLLQTELARTLAEQIRVELSPEASAHLNSAKAVRPEAYDAYLKGRFFWNKRSPAAMVSAENYFRQAIQADPNFASAYAGLADCYQIMVNLEQMEASEGYTHARAATLKALELDNSLAEAHTSLASIMGDFDWDWAGAEAEYKRALELNPNYATGHHWYAEFLAGLGRIDEATTQIKKALELDPLSPVISVSLAQMYCRAGRCQKGIEQLKQTMEIYPDFGEAHEALAQIYGYLGMYETALEEVKNAGDLPEGRKDFLLAYAAARSGRMQDALHLLHRFETESGLHHRDFDSAILYAALGNKEQAFVRLESARQGHDPFMAYFRAEFVLEGLRPDPRYTEMVRRMNMPR